MCSLYTAEFLRGMCRERENEGKSERRKKGKKESGRKREEEMGGV